jgi:hypothetical protein
MEIQRDGTVYEKFSIESEDGLSLMEQSILEIELHSGDSKRFTN